MAADETTTVGYPWEQLTLLQPDRYQLRITLSMVGPADTAVCTLELREGAAGQLAGLQTFSAHLGRVEMGELYGEIRRWSEGCADRLAPFR